MPRGDAFAAVVCRVVRWMDDGKMAVGLKTMKGSNGTE